MRRRVSAVVAAAVLCACGCGTLMSPRQLRRKNRYASRQCVQQSVLQRLWHDPAHRATHLEAVRRAAWLGRIDRWAQPAFDALLRAVDADKLDRRERAAVKVVLADLVRSQYDAGYKSGYYARWRHEHTGVDQRRKASAA